MKKPRSYLWIILGCIIVFCSLYLFIFRNYVSLAYTGNAPGWFQQIIDIIYPRFQVEKQRFELSFFLNKADQILIRSLLVLAAIWILLRIKSARSLVEKNVRVHSKGFYQILITFFYSGLLYFTWNWFLDYDQLVKMKPFYKGVLLFRLLHLPILPQVLYYTLHFFYIFSIVLVMCRYREVFFSVLSAIILVFFQGYLFSFEKIEHGYATLTYAAILMPALLYELKFQSKGSTSENIKLSSWTLFLIQCTIAGVYFLSGLEKLLVSGFSWTSAETFRTYIALHGQALGMKLAENELLSHLLPWGALLFQLLFILILFQSRFKYLFLVWGILFHLGTKILFGIGPYFSSWIFVYIFFIDWDSLFDRWKELIAKRHKNTQKGA